MRNTVSRTRTHSGIEHTVSGTGPHNQWDMNMQSVGCTFSWTGTHIQWDRNTQSVGHEHTISQTRTHNQWDAHSVEQEHTVSGTGTHSVALALHHQRIGYKLLCLTYQYVHKTTPQYLQELVSQCNPPCSLCSSFLCRLSVSGFRENKNKKYSTARSVRCSNPLEQAARQASPSKRTLLPFSSSRNHICFQL